MVTSKLIIKGCLGQSKDLYNTGRSDNSLSEQAAQLVFQALVQTRLG